ncbi:MAG: protease pro-enzyme activation domain-containing protein [Candidatus Methylomirabilales bacterium]
MASPKNPVPGSERTPLPGSRSVGAADADERLEVTVRVRSRAGKQLQDLVDQMSKAGPGSAGGPQPLTREQFEAAHAAAPADMDKVEAFAKANGLVVVEKSASRRSVVLSGTVAQFSAAFGIRLENYEHPSGTYRGRTGAVQVPDELKDIVEGVFGLDDRPQAKPHLRVKGSHGNIQWHAGGTSFTPVQLAKLYDFPTGGNGAGQCIGIIELGGGYRPADLATYFSEIKVSPAPQVLAASVDHGKNNPTGDPNGPDGEVMLDIEVAGAVAPGARIVVYFAPNTDRGFLDAVTTAVHDSKNKPSVISISWGGPESNWTPQAMQAFNQAFQAAAALGVTVCCAAGDDGSADGVNDGQNHVDFPASSPFALACGGTRVVASATSISSEVVWNDGPNGGSTGGGVSGAFALPTWQAGAHVPPSPKPGGGRGVPDVSGDADPVTGYRVRVDGVETVIGGTSAVAPLWAGLIALVNQHKGHPVGYINPRLYSNAGAFHDITNGSNGAFHAGPGWDPCTGLGSPDGTKVQNAL